MSAGLYLQTIQRITLPTLCSFTLNPSLISITSSFDMQHLLRMFFNNCISLTTARDVTLSVELLLGAS
jgi:hypothetical protein